MIEEWLKKYDVSSTEDLLSAKREIMQEVALAGLSRGGFFNHATFYGGTALRIFHGLKRYSEDLDFSLNYVEEQFSLEDYFQSIKEEFLILGLDVNLNIKKEVNTSSVESAFLKENAIWGMISLKEEFRPEKFFPHIKIKIEVDRTPPLLFKKEQLLLTNPYSFYVSCMTLESLFAGKIHAVLFRNWKSRVKGRDWYDLEWYIRKGVKLDLNSFLDRCINAGNFPKDKLELQQDEFMELIKAKIETLNIESAKDDVKIFIADKESLNIWSKKYFMDLVQHLKFG